MKIQIESNILRNLFKNVYFLNGTAYAGKSTIVRLLAEKYNGICCGENYHEELMANIDPEHQPGLCYFQTMSGWQEYVSRSPDEYERWYWGTSEEVTGFEIAELIRLSADRKVIVDTNIPCSVLKEISDYDHVVIMLSPQSMSVERFFDRGDAEKQFLLSEIAKCPEPEKTLRNFKDCIARVNSRKYYDLFAKS